jgi:hypothetical protein
VPEQNESADLKSEPLSSFSLGPADWQKRQ